MQKNWNLCFEFGFATEIYVIYGFQFQRLQYVYNTSYNYNKCDKTDHTSNFFVFWKYHFNLEWDMFWKWYC